MSAWLNPSSSECSPAGGRALALNSASMTSSTVPEETYARVGCSRLPRSR
ncbi:hypothetical protein ACFQZ3_13410 [Thermocatellispora tengchongensis]